MSAVTIQLASDTASVQCDRCGGCTAVATTDRSVLLTEVRRFLRAHHECTDLTGARMP